jgi:hypothetical protein
MIFTFFLFSRNILTSMGLFANIEFTYYEEILPPGHPGIRTKRKIIQFQKNPLCCCVLVAKNRRKL